MRRFASLALVLMLGGCGYHAWWNPPFTGGNQPYAPHGDSETLLRAEGRPVNVRPLTPQAGNVWPGPVPPTPTLQELEQQGGLVPGMEQPVVGSPANRGTTPAEEGGSPPYASPTPSQGSSVPPGPAPKMTPLPQQVPIRPGPAPKLPSAPQPGQVVPTPGGPGTISGGTSGYRTMTLPGGGSAIVVPNGNGTSTIIKPDGSIETIPTPK